MTKLDSEEQELLETFEKGEWQSVPNVASEMEQYRGYAEATFQGSKRVNLSISEKDFALLKKKAFEQGISYETLMSNILHKYVTGNLLET